MSRQSRNGVYVPRALGTAYAPAAEGESEGDYGWPVRERAAHLGGLREDDAGIRLRGLREDDARIKLGTAYAPAAEGESEGDYGWPVRERAAHLGQSSEALRVEQEAVEAAERGVAGKALFEEDIQEERWTRMRGLREDDAAILLRGLREDDAAILLKGLREEDAGIMLRGLREDDAAIVLRGLREDDAAILLRGLREDDAAILLRGLGTAYAPAAEGESEGDYGWPVRERAAHLGQNVRSGVVEDVNVELEGELGRRGFERGWKPYRAYRKKFDPIRKARTLRGKDVEIKGNVAFIGAEDFHPRFPVDVKIEGLGRIRTEARVMNGKLDGWLDFLRPLPSDETYLAKIRIVLEGWDRLKPALLGLPDQQRVAIGQNMEAAKAGFSRYESLRGFLAEGAGAKTLGRWDRVVRLEAYLPTLSKLIDQAQAFGPAPTQVQEQKKVNDAAVQDVTERSQAAKASDTFVDTVVPVAVGALGTAAVVTGLLLLL